MKTKKFFAVEVTDGTCNVLGHESGIYSKGDYSWMTESLNGGNGEYNMTEEEAEEVKADFEQAIKEKGLEWASVSVDSVELPIAENLQDVADYYNESEDISMLDALIDMVGAVNDCHETWGSLISQIVKVFQSEYNASDDDSVSDIKEYIIEDVRITANGGAFVGIGH